MFFYEHILLHVFASVVPCCQIGQYRTLNMLPDPGTHFWIILYLVLKQVNASKPFKNKLITFNTKHLQGLDKLVSSVLSTKGIYLQ